ncbi:MAG: hypothetical protein MR639_12315 [Clostridium sp.]|uniref:hypothetical protein n=1 Tax=Clostridium sp. TaxID=1506 RepID=UPI002A8E4E4D|nr:hypothetical protein [Clostridium sp.]MDY5099399.1 hypothetical protein [Clostridium sp.]
MKNTRKHRKSFYRNYKIKLLLLSTLILCLSFAIITQIDEAKTQGDNSTVQSQIFNYLSSSKNQKKTYEKAIDLNGGSSENTCVYFIAEVLRQNHIYMENETCNTAQLISKLENLGWKKDFDYTKLKPGDICFTTDGTPQNTGAPSHAYFFMKWKKEGSYDEAYIVDNQAKDYDGKIYHLRNIASVSNFNGLTKDPFSFFMRK